jgi:hypothetical protein
MYVHIYTSIFPHLVAGVFWNFDSFQWLLFNFTHIWKFKIYICILINVFIPVPCCLSRYGFHMVGYLHAVLFLPTSFTLFSLSHLCLLVFLGDANKFQFLALCSPLLYSFPFYSFSFHVYPINSLKYVFLVHTLIIQIISNCRIALFAWCFPLSLTSSPNNQLIFSKHFQFSTSPLPTWWYLLFFLLFNFTSL